MGKAHSVSPYAVYEICDLPMRSLGRGVPCIAGSMPGAKQSMILVGTRLTEVRGFSDFFSEFFTALRKTQFPPNMRMVVLCNRPNYELRAFQVSRRQRTQMAAPRPAQMPHRMRIPAHVWKDTHIHLHTPSL